MKYISALSPAIESLNIPQNFTEKNVLENTLKQDFANLTNVEVTD